MNKTVKYMIGLGATFLAGMAAEYLLANGFDKTWEKTKYVANKTQMAIMECGEKTKYVANKTKMAIIECDEALYDAHPKPLRDVMDFQSDLMNQGLRGMTKEETDQKREELKSDLDFKIKQYEKDKK